MTAYETLQQAASDWKDKLDKEQKILDALRKDPDYVKYTLVLSSGISHLNPQYTVASQYVKTQDAKISTSVNAVKDYTTNYNAALAAITDYEKNSPVGMQIATAAKSAMQTQTVKNIIYVLATLTGIGLAISLVMWYEKKKGKTKTVTT